MKTTFQRFMGEKISVIENGRPKKITRSAAVSRQMFNKAMGGDMRAMSETLKWAMLFDAEETTLLETPEQKQRNDNLMSAFLRDLEENRAVFDTKDEKAKLQGVKNDKPINIICDDDEE